MMKPMLCRWALFGRTPVAAACFTAWSYMHVVFILTCTFFAACSKPVSRVTIGPSIDLSVQGTTTWFIPGDALARAGKRPTLRLMWTHGTVHQEYIYSSEFRLRITVLVYATSNNGYVELSRTEVPGKQGRLTTGGNRLDLASLAAHSGELKVDIVVTKEDVLMASGSPYLIVAPDVVK